MKIWEAAYIAGIIDGEGSITLTRIHKGENRRPCVTISSNDVEMLSYIRNIAGGSIITKKNYNPKRHQQSYTLNVRNKKEVFCILENCSDFLRVPKKRKRAKYILKHYNKVTPRNGKYSKDMYIRKIEFEEQFFNL